MMRRDIYLCSH